MFESFPQSKVGLMGDFLKGLESWTNIRHTPFDIEQSWQLQPFSCSSNKTLGKYLESVSKRNQFSSNSKPKYSLDIVASCLLEGWGTRLTDLANACVGLGLSRTENRF